METLLFAILIVLAWIAFFTTKVLLAILKDVGNASAYAQYNNKHLFEINARLEEVNNRLRNIEMGSKY